MHVPLKRHLLDLHKRHMVEQVAFALEYGAESPRGAAMPFPRSPHDVMAAIVVCFECAGQVLDSTHNGSIPVPTEHAPFGQRKRIAYLAGYPWLELLREVERTQSILQKRLLNADEGLLQNIVAPIRETRRDEVSFRFHYWDGLYTTLSRAMYVSDMTLAGHLVYWTTYQPALLRTCYVAERHDGELSIRMLDRAAERVFPYDELCGVKMNMHYALAHMYRLDKRYLEAINELRKAIQCDGGTIIKGVFGR